MPKISKEDLFVKFVRLLGKKHVYHVLDLLMGEHPNPNNTMSFSNFKTGLEKRYIDISNPHLSNILKELMDLKIIVKRKKLTDLTDISYYYTYEGFMIVNSIIITAFNNLSLLYKMDTGTFNIPGTIKA